MCPRYSGSSRREASRGFVRNATSTRQAAVPASCRDGTSTPRSPSRTPRLATAVTRVTRSRTFCAKVRLCGEACRATQTSVPSTDASENLLKWMLRNRSAWLLRATAARSARERLLSPLRVRITSQLFCRRCFNRLATWSVRSFSFRLRGAGPVALLGDDPPTAVVPPCPGSMTIFRRSAMAAPFMRPPVLLRVLSLGPGYCFLRLLYPSLHPLPVHWLAGWECCPG